MGERQEQLQLERGLERGSLDSKEVLEERCGCFEVDLWDKVGNEQHCCQHAQVAI